MLTPEQTQPSKTLHALSHLTDSETRQTVSIFHPHALSQGDYWIQAGETPKTIAYVISGILRLYYINPRGNKFIKSFCAEHSFVAAYSALLTQQPSRLYLQALEDTQLLGADYGVYRSLSDSQTHSQHLNCKIAEHLFIKKERRESSLLLDYAKTRYLSFLKEYPDLAVRLKQHHIASYLGMTPVTLSRIRAQLRSH